MIDWVAVSVGILLLSTAPSGTGNEKDAIPSSLGELDDGGVIRVVLKVVPVANLRAASTLSCGKSASMSWMSRDNLFGALAGQNYAKLLGVRWNRRRQGFIQLLLEGDGLQLCHRWCFKLMVFGTRLRRDRRIISTMLGNARVGLSWM